MTRATNARVAGFTFLFYIVTGIAGMVAFNIATRGTTVAAQLTSIAANSTGMALSFICSLLTIICALTLAVTLYALTRDEDVDLARLAMSCRVIEGGINSSAAMALLALLRVAADNTTSPPAQSATAETVALVLLNVPGWSTAIGGTIFAVGSAIYSALFLRGRLIPTWLARLGVIASILLIVTIRFAATQFINSGIANLAWLPMLVFEVTLGFWLLTKGPLVLPKQTKQ
jgi:Domain of unknown function (DUF4386)